MNDDKYLGRYRIPSARAWWHQYNGGTYFVTICTKDRERYFGEINDSEMKLSSMGECLKEQILVTEKMRADMNVEIPLYVIMPNHVHLIVVIGNTVRRDAMHCVSTTDGMHCVSTNGKAFAPQSKNLASIIRGIKIGTKAFATKHNIEFAWQPRYHDHIVRNVDELNAIAIYIENNVVNWKEDDFYR